MRNKMKSVLNMPEKCCHVSITSKSVRDCLKWTKYPGCCLPWLIIIWGTRMAQWCDGSPPTIGPGSILFRCHMWVAFVVGSHPCPKVFLWMLWFSFLYKNRHLQIPIQPDRGPPWKPAKADVELFIFISSRKYTSLLQVMLFLICLPEHRRTIAP